MTETQTDIEPRFRNPDGREHPVNYDRTVLKKDGSLKSRSRVRIIDNDDLKIMSYKAINPETGKEVKLGAVDWVKVYALLDHLPPNNLARRVEQYYIIKERKTREKLQKTDYLLKSLIILLI